MEKYTFEQFWYELNIGYQLYFTYLDNRYLLTKVTKNCYSQELISTNKSKSPHPKLTMLTLKRVKEIFPFMKDIEHRIGITELE